jgi:hypothetical protein
LDKRCRATSVASVPRSANIATIALAETIIGLFKTEVIRRGGPWRQSKAVEFATLEKGSTGSTIAACLSHRHITPAEAESRCFAQIAGQAIAS